MTRVLFWPLPDAVPRGMLFFLQHSSSLFFMVLLNAERLTGRLNLSFNFWSVMSGCSPYSAPHLFRLFGRQGRFPATGIRTGWVTPCGTV
jgi:hypothetical protein